MLTHKHIFFFFQSCVTKHLINSVILKDSVALGLDLLRYENNIRPCVHKFWAFMAILKT
jgi:hypothetical protein